MEDSRRGDKGVGLVSLEDRGLLKLLVAEGGGLLKLLLPEVGCAAAGPGVGCGSGATCNGFPASVGGALPGILGALMNSFGFCTTQAREKAD